MTGDGMSAMVTGGGDMDTFVEANPRIPIVAIITAVSSSNADCPIEGAHY